MAIRILDAATVGRIAAGEVVERPSSVAKELIENALDAGATSITVEMKDGGESYLRVTDNGCGIQPSEVRLAFENHATSKLASPDDLHDIRTLGFRGEALPSIAAVSKVECVTRARGADTGVKATIEGGRFLGMTEAGCPEGTTITLRELFFNTPPRKAFLKKPAYEAGVLTDMVARLILGNPNVSIRLISGGKTVYHSFGDGNLTHAALAVYGREVAGKLLPVDSAIGGLRIHGLIGVGDLGKPTRAQQSFFINGRYVRSTLLSQALENACRGRVTVGMVPMCALNVLVPPASVDVNVHPNKLEVRFRDEATLRESALRIFETAFPKESMLQSAYAPNEDSVRPRVAITRTDAPVPINEGAPSVQDEALCEQKETETTPARDEAPRERDETTLELDGTTHAREAAPAQREIVIAPIGAMPGQKLAEPSVSPVEVVSTKAGALADKQTSVSKDAIPSMHIQTTVCYESEDSLLQQTTVCNAAAESIPDYRLIGVLFKTYLLVEMGERFILIDQHAAHERILYEKLVRKFGDDLPSQQLLTPMVLPITRAQMSQIEENGELLAQAGFQVESFGERDIQVRAVPLILGKAQMRPLFLDLCDRLDQLRRATEDIRLDAILQTACKHAVKAGDSLSKDEIDALLADMFTTDAPNTCPHGRPVAKVYTKKELERLFKRVQ